MTFTIEYKVNGLETGFVNITADNKADCLARMFTAFFYYHKTSVCKPISVRFGNQQLSYDEFWCIAHGLKIKSIPRRLKIWATKYWQRIFPETITETIWRSDIHKWETKKYFMSVIPYYQYKIWKDGKIMTENSWFKKSRNTCKYYNFTPLPSIRIGRTEFQETYRGNKWIISTNLVLDLDIE